jgi:glycosyltransferase involved in cell wall biosynthesis
MNTQPPATSGPQAIRTSLIIPVYNEAENLKPLLEEIVQAMRSHQEGWEVLFVDDGSQDRSLEVLRELAAAHPQVRYLSFAANCGQSAALAAGFQEARGEVFVTLDSDLQNDPADIPFMLTAYEQGQDMVIGRRRGRKDSWVKKLASRIANGIRNRLTNETVSDTGCSLKVLRADMAARLPMFTGMHRFLPTLMKMRGARVLEVPVNHRPRVHGSSKYGVWDRAFSALRDLFAVRWMQARNIRYSVKERSKER